MKKESSALKFYLIVIGITLTQTAFSQFIEWTGNGDNISWSDPANWEPNALPTLLDFVIISGPTAKVQFNETETTIAALILENAAKLELLGGKLIVDNQDCCDALFLSGGDTLFIANGATIEVDNADDGFNIVLGTTVIINHGQITIKNGIADDGFRVTDGKAIARN